MVEFNIKINPEQRLAYIPKEIVEAIGFEVKAVANRVAVLLYPKDMPLKEVIKSLKIIRQDLQHATELSKIEVIT